MNMELKCSIKETGNTVVTITNVNNTQLYLLSGDQDAQKVISK